MCKPADKDSEAPEHQEPAPMSEHEKAMKGLMGTPKEEVEAEERKEQRNKGRAKRPKRS